MRKLLILFALMVTPAWVLAAPVVVPSARTANMEVVTLTATITGACYPSGQGFTSTL